jgi:hypothetical protein
MSETNHLRGSIILVIIGFAFVLLGALASAAEEGTHFGILFLSLGGLVVAAGVLVEFFSLGPLLMSIVRSSQETVSLLRSQSLASNSSRPPQRPLSAEPSSPRTPPQPPASPTNDGLITLKL